MLDSHRDMTPKNYGTPERLAMEEMASLAQHLDGRITAILNNDLMPARDRVMAARHLIRMCNDLKAWTPRVSSTEG